LKFVPDYIRAIAVTAVSLNIGFTMFAKLVGEGYENPHADSDLPLDVNYAKIVEWLVSLTR